MSQRVTLEVARTLKRGDTLYHNIIEFTREDGTTIPATATVIGKVKEGGPEEFSLPIRRNYGAEVDGAFGNIGGEFWRTVPEKIIDQPVSRVRLQHAPSETASEPEQSGEPVRRARRGRVVHEEEAQPVARVRRTRVVEEEPEVAPVRRRRTRSG